MKCPNCGGKTMVTVTLPLKTVIWRERTCKSCEFKFDTAEMEDEADKPVYQMRDDVRGGWKRHNEARAAKKNGRG